MTRLFSLMLASRVCAPQSRLTGSWAFLGRRMGTQPLAAVLPGNTTLGSSDISTIAPVSALLLALYRPDLSFQAKEIARASNKRPPIEILIVALTYWTQGDKAEL